LTKNNEITIKKVLDSTKDFDEVIIIDTGSNDQTLKIAEKYLNVKIKKVPFSNFSDLRNFAAKQAKNEWILALDSDEVLSHKLVKEIKQLSLSSNTIYSIPFENYYNNKHIKSCGWKNEKHIRLYNKNKTGFLPALIHESIDKKEKKIVSLHHPICHFSYRNIDDFLKKMQFYSSLFACQYQNKKKSSFSKAIIHGLGAFFKSYIIKKGFLEGKEGFIISFYISNTAFYKYLKLSEKNVNNITIPSDK
jgi:glycosyltransferase involved in cell wall biosynthesis